MKKKLISLFLAFIMLVPFAEPVFADTNSYYYAEGWEDLVEFLDDLDDGEKVYIEVEPDTTWGAVYVKEDTAYIGADDVEIVFAKRSFTFGNFKDAIFEIGGDNVTLDFSGSEICCNSPSLNSQNEAAIIVDGDDCTIKNLDAVACWNRYGCGGAIRITDNDPDCHILNCGFYQCIARYGGAIYIDADDAVIENCYFTSCSSVKAGTDIYDNEGESKAINCKSFSSKDAFYGIKEIKNCSFMQDGHTVIINTGSIISEGDIWIIVATLVVAAAVVIFVTKKKTKE